MAVPAITAYLSTSLPTISLPPHSVVEVSQDDAVEEFTSPSRLSQYLYYDAFLGRTFNIQVPALTSNQVDTLRSFWVLRKGRTIPFKWLNPADNTIYYVRFAMASLTFEQITHDYWRCTLSLKQAHPLEITEPASSGA